MARNREAARKLRADMEATSEKAKPLNDAAIRKMKREQLVTLAETHDVEFTESTTNKTLAELIIKAREAANDGAGA